MAEIPATCDVVVIGGGPSGSVAASSLAKAGHEVVLFDKVKHPRNTVGEALIPHFWRFLDEIDATDRVNAANFLIKGGGMGVWSDKLRRVSFKQFGHKRPALHVERDIFDHILLNRTRDWGVKVFEEVAVTQVEQDDDGVTLRYRPVGDRSEGVIRAKYVVDASGQSAVVSKQYGLRVFDPNFKFMSVWGYYRRGKILSYDGAVSDWETRFDVKPPTIQARIDHDWSWIWYIPMRTRLSVGAVLPPDRFQQFKAGGGSPESKLREMVKAHPIIGKLIEDGSYIEGDTYVIKDYAYKPTELTIGRCLLVGDAAAFVDPINSAGVSFGCYAGYSAAWVINSALARPERRAAYLELFRETYAVRLALFRYSAAPDNCEVNESADLARRALLEASAEERQLILRQTMITSRATRLRRLFADMQIPERGDETFELRDSLLFGPNPTRNLTGSAG